MVPDLGSSRGESTASKISFSHGNVQERVPDNLNATISNIVRVRGSVPKDHP